MTAPIALFVYNRPAHTRETIEALRKCELAEQSDLFIFSDAPKTNKDADAVSEVREYIRSIDGFKSVSIGERNANFGLANSIINGVTSVINVHDRIIVLEDDLIVSPNFLRFMNDALDQYEDKPSVIQISGYMFPVKVDIDEDALFLPMTTSWGWATWKRAWQLFDPDAKGYASLKNDSMLRKRFNLDGAFDYFSMLENQLEGRINSWAIRWYLATFLNNGLTLYPRQSLVSNIGFDGSGTHCGASTPQFLRDRQERDSFKRIAVLPEVIAVHPAWGEMRSSIFPPMTSLWQKVKNRLQRTGLSSRLLRQK